MKKLKPIPLTMVYGKLNICMFDFELISKTFQINLFAS